MTDRNASDFRTSVRRVVASIPEGRVATYGGVAALAGRPGAARAVGSVLSSLDAETGLPWWRVVGSGGRITTRRSSRTAQLQKALLEAEGVEVGMVGKSPRIPWDRFGWQGKGERDADGIRVSPQAPADG